MNPYKRIFPFLFYLIKPQGDDVILQCFYNTNGTNQPSNPVLVGYLFLVLFSKSPNIQLTNAGRGEHERRDVSGVPLLLSCNKHDIVWQLPLFSSIFHLC